MYDIILATITSFVITYMAIPSIIKIATYRGLIDTPDDRKHHSASVPNLGGIAIFSGSIFSIIFWTPFEYFGELQYVLCAFIIIFLVGAKDDIYPLAPDKKFFGQLLAAVILIFKANIMITSMYGVFGLYELPYYMSIFLSLLTILVIINAFNFIDGIDGLCACIGLTSSAAFATWFMMIGRIDIAILGFTLAGSLFAFLKYNMEPAKIFMGDTGSMLIGIFGAILAILFVEINGSLTNNPWKIHSAPSVAIAFLSLPLFDLARVMLLRLLQKKSPFRPDRQHLHHILVDKGYSHRASTIILTLLNAIMSIIALSFQSFENNGILSLVIGIYLLFTLYILKVLPSKGITSLSRPFAEKNI